MSRPGVSALCFLVCVGVVLGGPERNDKTNDNNVHCRLPMKIGKCRAAFRKFYYDATNQTCQMFLYGGCDANANNFETKEECENTCRGVTGSVLPDESTPAPPQLLVKAARKAPASSQSEEEDDQPTSERGLADGLKVMSSEDFDELCGVDAVVGPCRAALPRWYYNSKKASCEMFIFGGCRGNKNNYFTQKLCMDTCTGVTVFSSSKKTDDAAAAELKVHCLVSPDPGPCRASFPMFYYNPDSNTCQSFIYGGCRGNGNRYSSMEECMNRCDKDGWFSSTNRTKNRWTAGLFLFITLAAISALLLAAIIIYTLRRRGLSHRTSSISDKQELLPDADEHSSGDSLSLPESPKLSKA